MKIFISFIFLFSLSGLALQPEAAVPVFYLQSGVGIRALDCPGGKVDLPAVKPLFTLQVEEKPVSSLDMTLENKTGGLVFSWRGKLRFRLRPEPPFNGTVNYLLEIENLASEKLKISNLVPFGALADNVYIEADGPASLTRTKLFRPGLAPVGVIVPDNAWELGYCSVETRRDGFRAAALARRAQTGAAERARFHTIMPPGTTISYRIFFEVFSGAWQNGLKIVFRDRYLYDLQEFDQELFQRPDLKWIRHKYLISCTYAWDYNFYDRSKGEYTLDAYLDMGQRFFGGFDVFILWPTWPTLGLDRRNQWDLYADLPGGLEKLYRLASSARKNGTEFFISYNPWDESTRDQDHMAGLSSLIAATGAGGVVLDTRGASSLDLQAAADRARPGVIMYSEGMAVPRDMPGIVSGRVHDAIFLTPPLNLNKLIKPDFAIFRVLQLSQGRIHRESALAFFNGYGVEINTFAPGRPDWMPEEYKFLGRTTRILRQNSAAFLDPDWTPLIPTLIDDILVNRWQDAEKTIYTIYSTRPAGVDAPLFEIEPDDEYRYLDLWHNEEMRIEKKNGRHYAVARVGAFEAAWLGTRREGAIGCLARFKKRLHSELRNDTLEFSAGEGQRILLWPGDPDYRKKPVEFKPGEHRISLREHFFRYEGKFVLQLFQDDRLLDQTVEYLQPGTPRLVSRREKTAPAAEVPPGMVEIPAAEFVFSRTIAEKFIPYPAPAEYPVKTEKFYLDVFPVSNRQFYEFMQTGVYSPADRNNFLKHWENGRPRPEQENHPVVYVSYEDALAYAAWAGKRLPSEEEWLQAGRGRAGRAYPWGNDFVEDRCNNALGETTPVDAFPLGASEFGVQDLVGNVWQMTADLYDNGSYEFLILKGGSHFKPTSSWWYVQGGPQKLSHAQMLLRVSPGFERNSTVGFRCAKDAL